MDTTVYRVLFFFVCVSVCGFSHPPLKCQLALVFHPNFHNSRLLFVGGLAEVASRMVC